MTATAEHADVAAGEPDTPQADSEIAEQCLALGYVRAHLLMTPTELADAKADLASYASCEGYRLGRVFVEQPDTVPDAFRQLIDEILEEKPAVILTPNALHLAVLGLPPRVMGMVYATTGVEVLLTNMPGRVQAMTS